jgi:hypothetical protein
MPGFLNKFIIGVQNFILQAGAKGLLTWLTIDASLKIKFRLGVKPKKK